MVRIPLALFVPQVSKLTAYSNPELFVQTKMEVSFDLSDRFELPVCVKAIHRTTHVPFLITDVENEFASVNDKRKCKLFHTVKEANDYVDNIMVPRYGDKWTFELVAFNAVEGKYKGNLREKRPERVSNTNMNIGSGRFIQTYNYPEEE